MTRVAAESKAVRPLTNQTSSASPIAPRTRPARIVSRSGRRRVTKGRVCVRRMRASVSRSSAWLRMEEQTATSAVPTSVWISFDQSKTPRPASAKPASVVTSTIMVRRALVNSERSVARECSSCAGSAGSAARGTDSTGMGAQEGFTQHLLWQVLRAIANANSWR